LEELNENGLASLEKELVPININNLNYEILIERKLVSFLETKMKDLPSEYSSLFFGKVSMENMKKYDFTRFNRNISKANKQ
jgi:hypothetical protein